MFESLNRKYSVVIGAGSQTVVIVTRGFALLSSASETFICTYWFGQATLVHVIVACAPLPASTGVVDGPGGAGHSVAVVAGVGGVVAPVGVAVVLVVAAEERRRANSSQKTATVGFSNNNPHK